MTEPFKNFGLLEGQRDSDWIAGVLPYEERNPSGDWTQYLPPGEWQADHGVDTMACVTFSALNCLEAQMRFYGKEKNLSDRYIAKLSNTQTTGNYLYRVADAIREFGVVPEYLWPAPSNFTWDTYYVPVPQSIIDQAERVNVRYEWLPKDANGMVTREVLKYHLKHAPIQVTVPGHAVMCFVSEEQVDRYFDSYKPFKKEWTSQFSSAMKLVYYDSITATPMTESEVVKIYVLAFYREPDATEKAYWIGKPLGEFLNTAIKDRAAFLKAHEQ